MRAGTGSGATSRSTREGSGVEVPFYEIRSKTGEILRKWSDLEPDPAGWDDPTMSRTVLTVAHLDQDPIEARPDRLRALCQRCHLTWDARPEQRAKRRQIYAELRGQIRLFPRD